MRYGDLIWNWHNKGGEEDYFSKFIFEYLAFIAILRAWKYQGDQTDRETIQMFKIDFRVRDMYVKKILSEKDLKIAWRKIIKELKTAPLVSSSRNLQDYDEGKYWNCSHVNSNMKSKSDQRKPNGMIHSLNDWENMIEFLYTIRNNLFHGVKYPSVERDKLLVEQGFKVLRPLVELLIETESVLTGEEAWDRIYS